MLPTKKQQILMLSLIFLEALGKKKKKTTKTKSQFKCSDLFLRELKIMSKIVDSIKSQECSVKREFHAGMKFQGSTPKENSFGNPPKRLSCVQQ